jgi:hypothetical protein
MHKEISRKFSKAEVRYEHPGKYPITRCGRCEHFEKPGRCVLVRGAIRPEDWCGLYTPKLDQEVEETCSRSEIS